MFQTIKKLLSKEPVVVPQEVVVHTPKIESRHLHKWELTAQTYAPPREKVDNLSGSSLEKAMFGVTSLLWECPTCGESKKEELLGSNGNSFEDLVIKVGRMGTQLVEFGGETYIFDKYYPQTKAGGIPLR